MQLRDIAWASIRRRKGRFSFMLAALTLGVGTVVALVSLSRAMQADVGAELDRFGANIVITPKARALDLSYGGIAVAGLSVDTQQLRTEDVDLVRTIPNKRNVSAVAPKLIGTIEVEGRRLLLIGVRFADERRVKSWWTIHGALPAAAGDVLLGSEASQALGRRAGTTVALAGEPRQVTGVLGTTGSVDDEAIFVDLGTAQRALHQPNAVTMIEVSALCSGCPIEDMVQQMSAILPNAKVAPIRQAVAARERGVRQFTRFAYAVSAIVLLVGTLVVMTTMMSSVVERTQEIGILRAVGYRRTQVATIILLETLAVNLAGGLTGWVAGTLIARTLGPAMAQTTTPIPVNVALGLAAIATAVVIGGAGGSYPAVRAARMDPAEALRHL